MRKVGCILSMLFLLLCFQVVPALSIPLDLSGFTGNATESGGTITFVDDFSSNWYEYYNMSYSIPNDAGILSFNYTLDLEPDGINDYLTFEIDYSPIFTITTEGSGGRSFDLSSYQGQTLNLAWVLYWGGDFDAQGAWATVSNIDLATADVAPVPEPATLLLVGAGLCGLPFLNRKKS
jgi:hypothetical protein